MNNAKINLPRKHTDGICHIFNVHSHITYLVSLAVIAEKKLDLSACVFLQTRGYSIPDENPNLMACDLIFPLSDISVYYNEKSPEACRQNMERLRNFVSTITAGRPFHLYLPCTHMLHAIILLSYDDCIAYSLIEEGLQVYLENAESQVYPHIARMELSETVLEKCHSRQLLYLGRRRPFCLFRHEKFDHAYCIDSQAFPFISDKTVVKNPFRKDECPDCADADAMLVLSNEQCVANLDMKPFIESLKVLIDRDFKVRGFKKIIYRTKEAANKEKYLDETHRFLQSYKDIKFVPMAADSIAENVINKYKLPVYSTICSISYYVAVVGAASRSFAPLYEDFDPGVRRIAGWDQYKKVLADKCEMYDKSFTSNLGKETHMINQNDETRNKFSWWKPYELHRKKPSTLETDIHIAIVADENYLSHSCVLIASILGTAKPGILHHFHLIHAQSFTTESQRKLEAFEKQNKISIIRHRIDSTRFDEMRLPIAHISQAMYYRFLLPSLIPQTVDKVLYLDGDMIVTRDLAELFSTDLGEHYAAVVMQQLTRWCVPPTAGYFNSGMLLLNLKKMRNENLEKNLFEYESKHRSKLQAPDQDVLNAMFKGNVLWMPFKWNMMTFNNRYVSYFQRLVTTTKICTEEEMAEDIATPAIIHFNCDQKPWNVRTDYADFYWKWAKRTPFYNKRLHYQVMSKKTPLVTIKNTLIHAIKRHIVKTFTVAKNVAKFVLRPFKPYVQRIVNVACAHQVRLMERGTAEHRNLLQLLDKYKKSNEAIAKDIVEVKAQLKGQVKTNQKNIIDTINGVREEQLNTMTQMLSKLPTSVQLGEMNQSILDMGSKIGTLQSVNETQALEWKSVLSTLANWKKELSETLVQWEQKHRAAMTEQIAELRKDIQDRKEKEFAARLLETEKRFEMEKQAAVEKVTAEIRSEKDKEFDRKLAEENEAYHFMRMKKDFPSLVVNTFAPFMKRQEKPFALIVGCSFSGTSILNTIVGQHPDIYPFRKNAITGKDEPIGESCLFDPRRNNCLSDHDILKKLDEVVIKASGYKTVLEKTPDNLFHLGRINMFLPNSKYICTVRDGRDVIASFLSLDGATQENCSYRIKYWTTCIDHMEKYMKIANNMKMVRLEDLITDPQKTIHEILEFLEIDHSPEIVDYMLRFHERGDNSVYVPPERVMTGSIVEGNRVERILSVRSIQTKQPLYKDTSRWRQDLPVEFWPLVYEKIGPALERLGYVENAEQSLKEELERRNTEIEATAELERQLEEKRRQCGSFPAKAA